MFATALLATAVPASSATAAGPTCHAVVTHVDDGDTIDIRVDGHIERVRYIGIDAPEIAHDGVGGARGGAAATRLNQTLLGDRHVRLEFDRERRDRYGRLLAYVWAGKVMVNLEMIRRGYAQALTIPPNVRYEPWFASAQTEARAARRGLWGDGDLDAAVTMSGRRGAGAVDEGLERGPRRAPSCHAGRRLGAGTIWPRRTAVECGARPAQSRVAPGFSRPDASGIMSGPWRTGPCSPRA